METHYWGYPYSNCLISVIVQRKRGERKRKKKKKREIRGQGGREGEKGESMSVLMLHEYIQLHIHTCAWLQALSDSVYMYM